VLYAAGTLTWFGFETGADYRFISRFDTIDETFALIIPDAEERVAAHIVDLRIARNFKVGAFKFGISIQANNVLQYNYVDVIGSIAPIRNFVLTLETVY
jgi:hypothetical protein